MQSAQFQLHAQIEERHWWFVARRRIMRGMIATILRDTRTDSSRPRVVDIGCGTGANLAALAGDYDCAGIDTSAEAIALARERFAHIDFVCGFAPHDIADRLARADVVLLTDVLEHVADDRGLLAGIVAALQPGAQLLLTVPANMRLWSLHDEAFGHFRRYDAAGLATVWDGLPVETRMLSYFNARLYPLVRGARAMSRLRGKTAGAAKTDFSLPAEPINRLLTHVFAGESQRLERAMDGKPAAGYRRGVSLMAVLRAHRA